MKTVTIRRTRRDVPLMIIITALGLFPGLYMMFESSPADIIFLWGALITLLAAVIAVFCFRVIFRYHSCFTFTKEGLEFRDNDKNKSSVNFFFRWEDIKTYRLETKTDRYYSNETNTWQESDVHAIVLTLEDGNSVHVSADKLSKRPGEMIALFDLYKKGD